MWAIYSVLRCDYVLRILKINSLIVLNNDIVAKSY